VPKALKKRLEERMDKRINFIIDNLSGLYHNFDIENGRREVWGIDIACDCGDIAIGLALAGADIVGTDFDPQKITVAKANAKKNGILYNLPKLEQSMQARGDNSQYKQRVQARGGNSQLAIASFRCEETTPSFFDKFKSDDWGLNFVIWFSQWQLFCKQYGYKAGLDALYKIGKFDTVLFFESSLESDNKEKLINILEQRFVKVEKIGIDEHRNGCPIFKCIGSSKR